MLRYLLAAALLLAPLPLAAEPMQCGDFAKGVSVLAEKYDERPAWTGASERPDIAFALFTARDGSTWTLLLVKRDGTACIFLTGERNQIAGAAK